MLSNSERNKRYRARHPDRSREQSESWRRRNPEKVNARKRAWRLRNPEKVKAERRRQYARRSADPIIREEDRAKLKLWFSSNGNRTRLQSARRAAQIQATPSWGQEGIADVYQEAEYQQTHVDHTVPLRSKLVCGLHVWDNLQLLTAQDNVRKGNKFDPLTLRFLFSRV